MALTIPVLVSFKKAFPEVRLSILTKDQFAPLFETLGVQVLVAETKGKHRGILGIYRLFRDLNANNKFTAVADLHHVLRSGILMFLYSFLQIKKASIHKDRDAYAKLTRKKNKILQPLPTRTDLYRKVFSDLGYEFDMAFTSIFPALPLLDDSILNLTGKKTQLWIGIAPFAAFQPKTYPPEQMKSLIGSLYQNRLYKVLFFGGGNKETAILNEWEGSFPGTINVSGKFSLANELKLMAHLDVMVAMDSANMHFASLAAIPVISVWGATHPVAGFIPIGQPDANQVQIELYCRPCSIYGNVPCYRGDHACMRDLPEQNILNRIKEVIDKVNGSNL